MALLGVFLTIASTAASMVPPYLTRPIIDDVLVPYQNGQSVPSSTSFPGCWEGLPWQPFLSWLLGWARTYVVAWVSERIAADLRNQTYAHLQRMSLEFFGGKRTGDLISRVSTDSDRICIFPLGQPAGFRQRRADDPDDRGHLAVHRFAPGPGHAGALAADRLPGAPGPQPACAADFSWAAGPGPK